MGGGGKDIQEMSAAGGPVSARNDLCNAPLTLIDTCYELHISVQWKHAAAVDADESESGHRSSPSLPDATFV